MLSNCDDIIRQHKAACLRVTSLLACKDLIWIGTSAGVILTIPAATCKTSTGSYNSVLDQPIVTGMRMCQKHTHFSTIEWSFQILQFNMMNFTSFVFVLCISPLYFLSGHCVHVVCCPRSRYPIWPHRTREIFNMCRLFWKNIEQWTIRYERNAKEEKCQHHIQPIAITVKCQKCW